MRAAEPAKHGSATVMGFQMHDCVWVVPQNICGKIT